VVGGRRGRNLGRPPEGVAPPGLLPQPLQLLHVGEVDAAQVRAGEPLGGTPLDHLAPGSVGPIGLAILPKRFHWSSNRQWAVDSRHQVISQARGL